MRSDAGETLVEVVIAMVILAGAISALLGGIATTVRVSTHHREQATANAVLRSYAEAIKENARVGYIPCATSYENLDGRYYRPDGWDAPINTVQGEGCPGSDLGLQHVQITLTTPRGKVQELELWIRRTTT